MHARVRQSFTEVRDPEAGGAQGVRVVRLQRREARLAGNRLQADEKNVAQKN